MADNPTGSAGGTSVPHDGQPPAATNGGAKAAASAAASKQATSAATSAMGGGGVAKAADVAGTVKDMKETRGQGVTKADIASVAATGIATGGTGAIVEGAMLVPKLKMMGAGGTSEQGDGGAGGVSPSQNDGNTGGGVGKAAGAAAAVPVVGVFAQFMLLMIIVKLLKGLLMALAALAANIANFFWAALVGIAKAAAHFVLGLATGMVSLLGGAVGLATAAAVVTGGGTLGLVLIVGVVSATLGGTGAANAMRDGALPADCTSGAVSDISNVTGGPVGSTSASTLASAKEVYSVLGGLGMSKENVAGILGNWTQESNIDPTSVQGIFSEPFAFGPAKQAAVGNTSNGLGLGQWTAGRHTTLLNYASSKGLTWYTVPTQLGFMLSPAEGSNATVVKDMISHSQGTPSAAADYFHNNWERSADKSLSVREANAVAWMGRMAGWTTDKTLADSILAQSGSAAIVAGQAAAANIASNCTTADAALTTGGTATPGGVDTAGAQAIINLYLKEGTAFLDKRYGSGGPGGCGSDHAMNCVSFSTYFVNKYTSFQQYAPGNGIQTAFSMAKMMGKTTSHTPTAYSVSSGPGSGPAGHTFVVLGVTKTSIILGEAGYCSSRGDVRVMPLSEATNGTWSYVDITNLMLPADKIYP